MLAPSKRKGSSSTLDNAVRDPLGDELMIAILFARSFSLTKIAESMKSVK